MTDAQENIMLEHMDKLHDHRCMFLFLTESISSVFEGGDAFGDDLYYGMHQLFHMVTDSMEKSIAAIDSVLKPPAPA
jgi:hypothetical protein